MICGSGKMRLAPISVFGAKRLAGPGDSLCFYRIPSRKYPIEVGENVLFMTANHADGTGL